MWRVVAGQQPSATMPATMPATITASWVADNGNGFNFSTPVQLWRTDQPAGPWEAQCTPGSASTCGFTASATRLGNDGQRAWFTASELRNDLLQG